MVTQLCQGWQKSNRFFIDKDLIGELFVQILIYPLLFAKHQGMLLPRYFVKICHNKPGSRKKYIHASFTGICAKDFYYFVSLGLSEFLNFNSFNVTEIQIWNNFIKICDKEQAFQEKWIHAFFTFKIEKFIIRFLECWLNSKF